MGFPMYYAYKGAPGPVPVGASHAAIYPYGPFETGDGSSVMLGIQNEREWAKLCSEVLDDASLATDPRFSNNTLRVKNRDALKAIIFTVFSNFSAPEVVAKLDNATIANATVNNMQDVWDHPQLRARGRWTEVDTPVGPIPALIPPGMPSLGSVDGVTPRMDPVPAVGEHNEAILAELAKQ
jgi:crotonobetainyl-CoA:carnitine CoA-transferase CaiB-like acyl-CoA transferase